MNFYFFRIQKEKKSINKRKKILFFFLSFCLVFPLKADEGMWVPLLLKRNQMDMQAKGCKLTAEDIYQVNGSSLKDAVVIFGGGCTGEVVSDQGLLLTNHHCGYGQIQSHSSLEHDYLTNGFWAASLAEELPCNGLSVTFLVRMEEVTTEVLQNLSETLSEAVRADSIKIRIKRIESRAVEGTHYQGRVVPFYYGNQYYLFVNEVFEDVRFVGAPPSNIGKFGGDTDNWVWPRHTGDFSVFRIYADSNNEPAPYNSKNQPYHPKKFLKIDLKGVEENDFTFVFGYPGRTQEYLSSYGIKQIVEVENPIRIEARTQRLDIIKKAMNTSALQRIQYAAKAASIANGWKKWIGETKGVERLEAVNRKEEYEKKFQQWTQSPSGLPYQGILTALKQSYHSLEPYNVMNVIFQEHVNAPEIVGFAYGFKKLCQVSEGLDTTICVEAQVEQMKKRTEAFYKNYDPNIDREIFEKLAFMTSSGNMVQVIDFEGINMEKQLDNFYKKSLFSQKEKLLKFLSQYEKGDYKKIEKDMLYKYSQLVYSQYFAQTRPMLALYQRRIDSLQRLYMKGQMEMVQEVKSLNSHLLADTNIPVFYPDANFTLRVSYGKVAGFSPSDAQHYNYYTTLNGIMQKENPEIYDYVVEDKLKTLYLNKDYGRYANQKGEMPVGFIATNHTTGGNSGSPVLNAEGNLIGLNFDRNWEGTMSDIIYDPDLCRNISLDIRYCLFIIDKFAGAHRLIEEMSLVE
ncbi:MAG: S46 family peptidase [Bacteroidales bacterium]